MSLTASLVDTVQTELAGWKAQKLVECVRDPVTKKPLGDPKNQAGSIEVAKYWREGVGDLQRNGCSDVPWSAAFICWCLRKAGVKLEDFPFNASHQTYIRWAIKNAKLEKAGKLYYGVRADSYQPRPGDIIAQWRKAKPTDPDPGITFDNQPDEFYSSHCDIVVDATASKITAVGGNVSDRVKDSVFGAAGGVLSPKKELICVMRLAAP